MQRILAPFSWAGGKRLVADTVWQALGAPRVYVEPFFGSGAVLLSRDPTQAEIETVNDADGLLCNFWRAVKRKPREVAEHADYPVSEIDLEARHQELVDRLGEVRDRLRTDPRWCDPELAGWWVWGVSQWIGGGWCATRPTAAPDVQHRIPMAAGSNAGRGVHRKRPMVAGSNSGKGVHRQMPSAYGRGGSGVHAHSLNGESLEPWFDALSARLRRVRIVSGDFARVLTKSTLYVEGENSAGVFLDPPYSHALRAKKLYAIEDETASARAREWAIAHQLDPNLRIVLAGLEGEHAMPSCWRCIEWTGAPGLGRLSGNRYRERLWLSPNCRDLTNGPLFQQGAAS